MFYKVSMGNGYCGYDDEFIAERDYVLEMDEVIDLYDYRDGGSGLDPYDEDEYESYDDYIADIIDNTYWVEITEEEFLALREKGWPEK